MSAHKPQLIWAHGLLGSVKTDEFLSPLDFNALARACELRRFDANGHGENTQDAAGMQCWPTLATAHAQQLRAGAVGFLGGQSMGAATALLACTLAPENAAFKPRGLILMTPPVLWQARAAQAHKWQQLGKLLQNPNPALLRMLTQISPPLPAFLAPDATSIDGWCQHLLDQSKRSPGRLQRVLDDAAASDLPAAGSLEIDVPTLLLAWAHDDTHPLASATGLLECLPNAELEIARSADEVAAWTPRIIEFMARHS